MGNLENYILNPYSKHFNYEINKNFSANRSISRIL